MANSYIYSTLSLLSGAAFGAAAMFILDPDQGGKRRGQISEAAEQAVNTASDHAHSAVSRAKAELADSVQELKGRIHDHASHIAARASDVADRAQNTRDELYDRANSLYSRAKSSARRQAGMVESHPYRTAGEITAGTVGVLALGAGLMFFLDPARGNARRAWANDKIFSWSNKASKSASGYGRHVGNKIKGAVAEVKSAMPEEVSHSVENAARAAADAVSNAAHSTTHSDRNI